MPIVTSELKSPGAPFSIIDSSLVNGGFHVVNKRTDLDTLNPLTLKVGMYVAVNEEQGKIYECTELVAGVDDFGDPFLEKITFVPLTVGSSTGPKHLVNRLTKKISFNEISPLQVIEMPVDLGCRSCIVTYLRITSGRKVELEIFGHKDKSDPIPYLFNSMHRYFDDGSTYLQNKARFQYKKFSVLINTEKDPIDQRIFLFRCRSLEDEVYRTSLADYSIDLDVFLTYLPLEA